MPFPKLEKFEITQKICNKVFYTLYDAVNRKNGKRIFLKLIDKEFSTNEKNIFKFFNIARIITLLNSPYICKIYGTGKDQDYYYIITEPIDSEPLSSLDLENLSYRELINIFLKIGMTLRYAHLRGLIHGLLNPECIYVAPDGGIKIDDFGFYTLTPLLSEKKDKDVLNLTHYVAPEVFHEVSKIDGRADIYSLGVILFKLITGHFPFNGSHAAFIQNRQLLTSVPSMSELVPDIPRSLENLVSKSLNKNPEYRFHNFKNFVEELKAIKCESSDSTEETKQIEREFNLLHTRYDSQDVFTPEPEIEPSVQQRFKEFWNETLLSRKYLLTGLSILVLLIFFIGIKSFNKKTATSVEDISTLAPQTPVGISEGNEARLLDQGLPSAAKEDSAEVSFAETPGIAEAGPVSEPEKPGSKQPSTDGDLPVEHKKTTEAPPSAIATTSSAIFHVKSRNKPIDAYVFIDEKFKGKADNQGKLEVKGLKPNRTYTIKISKDGYSTVTQQFTARNKTSVLSFDLKPKLDIFGTVILDALPKADSIYVDGKLYKGKTPLKVTLPGGEHRVRFVNLALNASWEKVVNLKVGQVLRVRHDFNLTETGSVAISLKNAAEYGFGYVYVDGKLWDKKPNTTPLKINLPIGSHTIAVKRDGFDSIPKDIIVAVEKGVTKYVSFTFTKME